jgi:hypothetical protein
MNGTDEYVMDTLVTQDKMKILVYDLLVSEAWKEKVYPHIDEQIANISSVRSYMVVSKLIFFPRHHDINCFFLL